MRNTINNVSTFILGLILPVTAFLIPVTFLPLTVDFFTPHKEIILITLAAVALLAWALRVVAMGELRLTVTPALLPALLLAIVYIVSTFVQAPNLVQAMLGQTSIVIALVVILLTTTSVLNNKSHLMQTIMASVVAMVISALFLIYEFSGVGKAISSAPWLANNSLNPLGGPLPYLTLAIPLIPAMIFLAIKSDKTPLKLGLFIASAIMVIASVMAILLLTPQNGVPRLVLLPLSAGWTITVEIFKTLKTALLGTGPESFSTAFTLYKPFSLNVGQLWNIRFGSSTDEVLTIVTTVGLLGLVFYLLTTVRTLLIYTRQKALATPVTVAVRIALALALIVQLLVPATISLWVFTFLMLILASIDMKSTDLTNEIAISFFAIRSVKQATEDTNVPAHVRKQRQIFPWMVLALSLILVGATFYFHGKAYAAQLVYYRSLESAAANKGTDTYNQQIHAIDLNPFDPTVRISYSQTNLALANAIAAKGNLSDQDKANITQLIQQAIREAKAATVLNPQDAAAWQNLAAVYRQLVNLAQGADNWAVAAYTQAIRFDPLNPQLRLDLGGLYYSLRNYDEATNLFQQAVDAKPNWANAYYNLATAYKENKQYTKAYQMMQVVTQLLDKNSGDYTKAQTELSDLQKMAEKEVAGQAPQSNTPSVPNDQTTSQAPLATPTPLPKPTVQPIKLPDGAGLNIPSPTPTQAGSTTTPTPSASVTPTPTPTPAQ